MRLRGRCDMAAGAHMAGLLPLHGKGLVDALFTEGSMLPKAGVAAGSGRHGGAAAAGAAAKGPARGALRTGASHMRKRGVGPLHAVRLTHCTDYADLDVALQAVVKQDIGTGCSLYLIVHAASPARWATEPLGHACHTSHTCGPSVGFARRQCTACA